MQTLFHGLGRDVAPITIHSNNLNAIKYEEDLTMRSKFVNVGGSWS